MPFSDPPIPIPMLTLTPMPMLTPMPTLTTLTTRRRREEVRFPESMLQMLQMLQKLPLWKQQS